jgi:dTMP kinase
MFIVFEGIDGSGKTTISNRVATALRGRGLKVEHLREGGAFASTVTQGIRDFCRDARNLALTPRAELLMYVAREVQLADEVLKPALAQADVVIADRYFYTAEVLARAGRELSSAVVDPIVNAGAAGLWPDIAFLIDVDPSVARGRRKVAKILVPDNRPGSRKGLTGGGLQQKLRDGYRALAARDPARWVEIDNSDADLEQVIERVLTIIERARASGAADAVAHAHTMPPDTATEPIADPFAARDTFLAWVDRRSSREPQLAAYVLAGLSGPGVDERRQALAGRAPRVVARGLKGLSDAVSWQLRRRLLDAAPQEVAASLVDEAAEANEAWTLRELLGEVAPAEVAASLEGLDDETAWALREDLYPQAPDAVVGSLALLDTPRSWALRERWLEDGGGIERAISSYTAARAAARSVTGLDEEMAWALRKAARAYSPVAALTSLRGLGSDKAWHWREGALGLAPKAVLGTIAGLDDPRSWQMRLAMAPRCREALDSMIGLDTEIGWEIRTACLMIWPASVVKSLGVLVNGARGAELLRAALSAFPRNITLLKHATAIALGAHLASTVLAA